MPGEALAIRDEYEQIAALLEAQSGSLSRIGARLDDWTTTRAAEQDRLAEQSRILADLDREIATHTTLLTEASAERRKQITLLEHGIERLAQVFPLLNRLLSSPPRPDQDRLTDIKGIGPVYAGKLYEAGIQTFRQLAAMTPDELYALINEPSWRMKSIKAESWIAQAGHLASQREKVEAIQ
ncbi:MAG: DUF4332 domain-containing protein [Anaerolineae bacterium]|nr:DUF4332 domain-containing protein [Anaerolineae bacterium]